MSFKISLQVKSSITLLISLAMSFFIFTSINFYILRNKQRPIRAVNFKIGNNQPETSAHFLPKKPLVEFMQTHNLGEIDCIEDNQYFLDLPIKFYNIQFRNNNSSTHKLMVGYDHIHLNNGYLFYVEN